MAGTKRQRSPSPSRLYSNKSRAKASVEARVDPVYGQRSALPGLDADTLDGDDGDQDAVDALSYLRAVRLVLLSFYYIYSYFQSRAEFLFYNC
jgi:hypothetical protein